MKTLTQLHVRWMIRRDMPEVLQIENLCCRRPWAEADFLARLQNRDVIPLVVERNELVIGYCLHELLTNRIKLTRLAVHPDHVRSGVATVFVDRLKKKLTERRQCIAAVVPERMLGMQLFLRHHGFIATKIIRSKCGHGDCYRMEYLQQ